MGNASAELAGVSSVLVLSTDGAAGGGDSVYTELLADALGGGNGPAAVEQLVERDAVDEYPDYGVYLRTGAEAAHTACVTVTGGEGTSEETGSGQPPLAEQGDAVQPGRGVEVFRFREAGRYTVEVDIERTTEAETLDLADSAFEDGTARITTFEIRNASTVRVERSEPSRDLLPSGRRTIRWSQRSSSSSGRGEGPRKNRDRRFRGRNHGPRTQR
jgi:hypothetical protein